jgi:hypothetical protein
MHVRATLRMDGGREVRVEVLREDPDHDEILVRRMGGERSAGEQDLIAVIAAHLAEARPHAAGTTERMLAGDRDRPY